LARVFTDAVPCHPELGTYEVTLAGRGVFHVTAAGIDEEGNFIAPFHFTGTTAGTFVWIPSDGAGPTFTGSFTQRVGENMNTQKQDRDRCVSPSCDRLRRLPLLSSRDLPRQD